MCVIHQSDAFSNHEVKVVAPHQSDADLKAYYDLRMKEIDEEIALLDKKDNEAHREHERDLERFELEKMRLENEQLKKENERLGIEYQAKLDQIRADVNANFEVEAAKIKLRNDDKFEEFERLVYKKSRLNSAELAAVIGIRMSRIESQHMQLMELIIPPP